MAQVFAAAGGKAKAARKMARGAGVGVINGDAHGRRTLTQGWSIAKRNFPCREEIQMAENPSTDRSKRIYRVDKFIVPPHAREAFIGKVRITHELLRTLPGFLQDFVLEQSAGPGEFNFVTLAEWENPECFENAKAAVLALHKQMNFNPQEVFARLGIQSDLANYQRIDAQQAAAGDAATRRG